MQTRTILVGAASFLAGVLATLAFVWLSIAGRGDRQAATVSTPTAAAVQPAPAQAPAAPSLLDRIFRQDMLNVQVAYLEHMVGPAKTVDTDGTRHYVVEGCQVSVRSDGQSIASLRLEIGDRCTVDLGNLVGNGLPTANRMTFGDFARFAADPQFLADCLTLCGNAYDPSVYLYWQGPHSFNFEEITVGVALVSSDAIEASEAIQDTMRGRGQDYIVDTKFNCDRAFDAAAVKALDKVRIGFIEVGYHTRPAGTECGEAAP